MTQRNVVRFIKERRTIKVLHIFRSYSALIVVISSALLVASTNLAAGRESSGFLFGYFGSEEDTGNPLKDKMFLQAKKETSVALAPLAEASTSPDPDKKDNNDEEDLPLVQGQALLSSTSPVKKDPEEDGGVTIYEVQSGDTVSSIAKAHKVSVNTIMWANDLDNVDEIMPGDKIFILPVSGLSYTVKKGDTIDSIADKFKADKSQIISFNDMPANGDVVEGQEIIIPDGEKEGTTQNNNAGNNSSLGISPRSWQSFGSTDKDDSNEESGSVSPSGKPGAGHSYPYGYCTWYVAQKRYVPWGGNAGTWLYHAKAAGYSTGHTPKAGAIMVTSESWWGHVALVEKVNKDGTFVVSEMNYEHFAKRDVRTVDASSRVIKGFIY